MSERTPIWFSCEEDAERYTCATEDEAIEEYLDGCSTPLPETVTVIGVTPITITEAERNGWAARVLEDLLEAVDEEYGDPDEGTGHTEGMADAARLFVNAVLAQYTVFSCEKVSEREVDSREWVAANAPHWLTDNPQLFATAGAPARPTDRGEK